jgi:hypothetical protein
MIDNWEIGLMCLVLPKPLLDCNMAVALVSITKDTDGLLALHVIDT